VFVSGPRCEMVGGPPSDRVIERGVLVILDMSVIVRGYRGDVCNTFVCGAKPTTEQRRLFDACLDALTAGIEQVRAGRAARDIDAAVRSSFAGKHLAENFRSHSGHGIGLGHPDPPYLVPASTDTLVAGDVIAIEPGQYISGVAGMRYERNFLVTDEGCEVLTHLPHELDQEA
ncbi:MAG: M24 family metallopeptidase, partial [Pirellulales bacterium]